MRRLTHTLFFPLLAALLLFPPSSYAANPDASEYDKCIDLARQSPREGLAEALAWGSRDGGEPASHCTAIAMIELRQYAEGATRLEFLATGSSRPAHLRAGMLDQAAQAWMLNKD